MSYRAFSNSYISLLVFIFFLFSHSAIANHPQENTLVISNSKAWKPFSYMEDGQAKGLLIDFWKLYAQRTGQNVRFELVDWQASLDLVARGDAQIHAGLLYSESRSEFFEFGRELLNIQTSIYINKHLMTLIDADVAKLKLPVGVVLGGYEQEYISNKYPDIALITYANNELMFEAVRHQDISIFIADKQVANFYMVSLLPRPNDFIVLLQLYDKPIRFAVGKNEMKLLHSIEKGLNKLTQGDIDQIKQKWINTETKVPVWFYRALYSSLLFIAFTYIYILRKAVEKRTLQLSIANKKLTKQANSDVLTGLYNRRFLMGYLQELQSYKNKSSFALLMIDIDFFKPINDTHGHPVGDVVLTILAKRIQSCIRGNDVLARLGGEEFCIVLSDISTDNMKTICTNINQNIADHPFRHGELQFKVTVSIGALHIPKLQKWSSERIFQQADKLLYKAKNNGRDQTIYAGFIHSYPFSVASF